MYRTPTLQQYRTIRPSLRLVGTSYLITFNYTGIAVSSGVLGKLRTAVKSFDYIANLAISGRILNIAHKTTYSIAISVPITPTSGQFNKIVVTAQYLDYDGVPLSGTVTFVPSRWVINAARGQIVLPKPYTAMLTITGTISIGIPASDDPDMIPFDILRYNIKENIANGRTLLNVKIPYSALTTGYDLSSITSW